MKIVPISSLLQLERTNHARKGKFLFHQLLEGRESDVDNFSLQLVRTFDDFYSPRHRHNFDQIRVQIEGECDFTRDGRMVPGSVSYFPESTPYGPQKNDGEALVLVLQFGGASGHGYISERMYHDTIGELKTCGEFKDGFYVPEGSTEGKDAFEAVWERVNKKQIQYAPQRYASPIFMHPAAFEWSAVRGMSGVEAKSLGIFTERKVGIRLLRLQPGGVAGVDGHTLGFVLRGVGHSGGVAMSRHDAFEIHPEESVSLSTNTGLDVLLIDLQASDKVQPPNRLATDELATA